MKVILGLGNPGPQYAETRHNVGFLVVDELARRWGLGASTLECNALVVEDTKRGVLLVKPQTYMNRSGHAARCLVERRELNPSSVMVVFDEVNLGVGTLRFRRGGSPGGHRGLESILENLRSPQIPRLRLGVAEGDAVPGEDFVDYVLNPPSEEYQGDVDQMIIRAADACELWVSEGIDAAMNQFNADPS